MAAAQWDDLDGTSTLTRALRGLQAFFAFINLCIYIALASFQHKHGVGPSFLVVFALMNIISSLLMSGLLLGVAFFSEQMKMFRSLAQGMRQIRIAIIVNGSQVFFLGILALATTISANGGGCKNADSDEHASEKGYKDALGGFCRNKRSGAAFFWLLFVTWLVSLCLTLRTWYQIRKNPRSTSFQSPEAITATDEAFDPNAEPFETPYDPPTMSQLERGGYRSGGDYYNRDGLFNESAQGYDPPPQVPTLPSYEGRPKRSAELPPGGIYGSRDPFDDRQAVQEARYEDPYDRIRASMDVAAENGRRYQ